MYFIMILSLPQSARQSVSFGSQEQAAKIWIGRKVKSMRLIKSKNFIIFKRKIKQI